MNNIPVFVVNSAQGFYEQLVAFKPDPVSGKPDPAAVQNFLVRHPETARAMDLIRARAVSPSFADSTYNSLDAFRMVNASGVSTPVRWAVVPLREFVSAAGTQPAGADENYLFDDLIARIQRQPQQWRLVITVGEPGDPTDDATLPWPDNRRRIDAGLISIDHVSSEDSSSGSCIDINYDPLVLPAGIEPSDDPLLSARSAVYAASFTIRAGEKGKKAPSAVSPREVQAPREVHPGETQ
jgi:catalase